QEISVPLIGYRRCLIMFYIRSLFTNLRTRLSPGTPKSFGTGPIEHQKQSAQRATLRPSRALVTSKKINYFSSESEPESKSESDSPSFLSLSSAAASVSESESTS